MKPELIPANPQTGAPAQIKITQQYGQSLGLSIETEAIAEKELLHQEGKPGANDLWYRDTPEVRRILRVEE